jgi:hypothetical protein
MQEMTGAWLGLLLLWAADRAESESGRGLAWWKLVGVAIVAMLLFLTKYSFGLFFLPGLIAALLTISWPWRASRQAWVALAVAITCYLAVGGLWFLLTDRATMLLFFTDHPSYSAPFSPENLLYQVRLWFAGYSVNWMSGLIALLLALVGAVSRWRQLAVRVAVWSALAAFVVLTLSTTDEPRHFLPVVPAVWLLAGLGLVEVLRWLQGKPGGGWTGSALSSLLLVGVLAGAWGRAASLSSELAAQFEGTPALFQLHKFALHQVDLVRPLLFIGDFNDQNTLLAVRWQAAVITQRSLWALDIDYFPFENHEHSLIRTHRKAQIATVDPTFPRRYMNEVLARGHFAFIVEIKQPGHDFGPRAANPEDPLCGYPTVGEYFDGWLVVVYDVRSEPKPCLSS